MRATKWYFVAAAAAAVAGCAARSTPKTPGRIGEAEIVRTVQVIELRGRGAAPELRSTTAQGSTTAQAAEATTAPPPELVPLSDSIFECTFDPQCVIVDYGCGDAPPVAVNREHEALLREHMQARECETAASVPDCGAGECELHRLAVCDQHKCARLEFHMVGEAATRLTLVHNRFRPR
jgi:hypothetical protein